MGCSPVSALNILTGDEFKETAQSLVSEYIQRKSTQSVLPRLRLNGSIDLFFRDCVIGNASASTLATPAHINLINAREEFATYINKQISFQDTAAKKGAFLYDFAHRITNRLGFVTYEVDDEAEVGVMFEVMNARGRTLTDMEKVKNFLLYMGSRVSDNKNTLSALTKEVNETWSIVLEAINAAGPTGNEDQFLRYHWAIYPSAGWYDDGRARTFDIHRAVKNTLNLRTKSKYEIYSAILNYLSSLRSLVISYRDVLNAQYPHAFSGLGSNKDKVVNRATSLQRIGRTATVLPILMAAHNQFGSDSVGLGEIFRLCETLAFRLAATGKRANAGDTYAYGIAAEVMKGELTTPMVAEKIKSLVNYYCTDYQLTATLLDPVQDFYRWSPLKYFLFEYERHRIDQMALKFTMDWSAVFRRDKKDSIEHILPQGDNTTAVTYWGNRFTPDEHTAYRNRLGNLCLTEWNSSYSNKPFPEKRGLPTDGPDAKTYQNSLWRMERDLAAQNDWTPATIEERQKKLAEFGLKRWNI